MMRRFVGGAGGGTGCVIVTNCPPTLNVPVRAEPLGFAVALKAIVALPVPEVALVIVSQTALLVAVQAQLLPVVVKATFPVPPVPETDWLAGETE
jgi:hypothetical protein